VFCVIFSFFKKLSNYSSYCSLSEVPEGLNVFNSDAASNGNFDGIVSLSGNWLSSSGGDALIDSDVSADFSVEGGLVITRSSVDHKGTFAASGGWSFSTLSFPKTYSTSCLSKILHRNIHNVNDTPLGSEVE